MSPTRLGRVAALVAAVVAAPAATAAPPAPSLAVATVQAAFPSTVLVRAVSVDAPGTAFAGTAGAGVYAFSGGMWTQLPTAGLGSLDVRDVLAVPGMPGVVLAATEGGGIARFSGGVWTTVNASLVYARGFAEHLGVLYATGDQAPSTPGGTSSVWRSADGGLTWTRTSIVTPTAVEPWALTFAHGTNTLYVATRKGLWKSEDLGATFAVTSFMNNNDDAYDVLAVGTTVLIGTRDGMRRSTDAGATFGPLFSAGPGRDRNVQNFGYDPVSGRLFMPNNGTTGLRVSTDLGLTFAPVALAPIPTGEFDRVFVDAAHDRIFMFGRNGGLTVAVLSAATAADAFDAPGAFALRVSGPNPTLAGRTTLRLIAPQAATARVEAFDVLGRRVVDVTANVSAGGSDVPLDLSATAPGVYVVRALVGGQQTTTRIVRR